jgi:hypothetical protein
MTIPAGAYPSIGYEVSGLSGVSLGSVSAHAPLASGFATCEQHGNVYLGTVSGKPAEIHINPNGQGFAVYIYDI